MSRKQEIDILLDYSNKQFNEIKIDYLKSMDTQILEKSTHV